METGMTLRMIFIVSLLVTSCTLVIAQAKITIAPESTIDGDTISLGQISKIAFAADARRLAEISLGYAPGVGMTREISLASVQLSLKAAGFSESEVVVVAPTRITVRRAAQVVDLQMIRDAVKTAVMKQFDGTNTTCEIVRIDLTEVPNVAVGSIDVTASLSGARNFAERVPVSVEVRVGGRLVRTLTATAEIALYADVAIAANDIAANKQVGEKDVRIERTRLERSPSSYIRDIAAFKAVQAVRPITAGRPIMADSIVAAMVIKLGDPVRIEARSGRIQIFVNGEARANGRIGERISVKNKDSGAILQAIVVDQGLVKLVI